MPGGAGVGRGWGGGWTGGLGGRWQRREHWDEGMEPGDGDHGCPPFFTPSSSSGEGRGGGCGTQNPAAGTLLPGDL